MTGLRLIAGLGNPGSKYEQTRHNIGAVYVAELAQRAGIRLVADKAFKGRIGKGRFHGHDVLMLLPDTYMNLSGESVGAVQRFYKLTAAEILVAYDEVAFGPGEVRLKVGGGAGGHNGIRSVISSLGNDQGFVRLRIGVGHPGDKERMIGYLTSDRMPDAERRVVEDALRFDDQVWRYLLDGDQQKAMTLLHAPTGSPDGKGD